MRKVIVLGSLNMDLSIACNRMPKNGETLNGYEFIMNPGGKGGNQAVACARSEGLTYMIASVGNDTFGQLLKDELHKAKINTHYVKEAVTSTGIAMIIRNNHDNRILLDSGANHTICEQVIQGAFSKIANEHDIFLTQLENNISAVAYGLKLAKKYGMYTIFNPAPAASLPSEIYQNVDLFIVNQSECEFICGIYPKDTSTINDALSKFANFDCDVIITLGKQGSVAWIEGKRYKMIAYQVEVLDTTGAGDTFVGALCAKLSQQVDVEEALEYANAASTLTVTKIGAQGSIPNKDTIEQFIKG